MQKAFYSLGALRELLIAANRRYLEFLSQLTDPSAGVHTVEQQAEVVRQDGRTYRGFNLVAPDDLKLLVTLACGEWAISGFRNRSLRTVLTDHTGSQISRLLKRLHIRQMINKIGHTYKYYLTATGQRVVLTALKLRELVVIPSLAEPIPINP
jgi:hypothetical protein